MQRIAWSDTRAELERLSAEHELVLSEDGRAFETKDGSVRFEPAALVAIPDGIRSVEGYLVELGSPGLHALLLMRAGAAALGIWQDDELLRHKAIKKYVVRGRGRAQTTHLKTKGKSRYGSRLRLQNAQRLLVEVNEKLRGWDEEFGRPRHAYYACPTRSWPELFATNPAPPWPHELFERIRLHTHTPDFAELRRVHWQLAHGSLSGPDLKADDE